LTSEALSIPAHEISSDYYESRLLKKYKVANINCWYC